MKQVRIIIGLGLVLLVAALVAAQDAVSPAELELSGTPEEICDAATPAIEPETREYSEAEQVLEDGIDYRAVFCTDAGPIYFDLLEDYAPVTVNNFVFLAQNNYYNNTIFHRVIEDFMAQGGDPTATGTGNPGYRFQDEPVGFLIFDRPGYLAMANAGRGTNGSQFFITYVPTEHLNYQHTIFGRVLEGQDIAESIQLRDPAVANAPATTLETVVIIDDPEDVTSDYENPLPVADADAIADGLRLVGGADRLPPELTLGFVAPVVTETAEVVEAAPESVQEDYAALLEEHGHEFRVTATLGNAPCDTRFLFEELTYAVDAFESEDAATAVLESDTLGALNEAAGYEYVESNVPVYISETESRCTETEAVAALTYVQRGRYVVTASGIFPAEFVSQVTEEAMGFVVALSVPQIFEPGLADAYLAELP